MRPNQGTQFGQDFRRGTTGINYLGHAVRELQFPELVRTTAHMIRFFVGLTGHRKLGMNLEDDGQTRGCDRGV